MTCRIRISPLNHEAVTVYWRLLNLGAIELRAAGGGARTPARGGAALALAVASMHVLADDDNDDDDDEGGGGLGEEEDDEEEEEEEEDDEGERAASPAAERDGDSDRRATGAVWSVEEEGGDAPTAADADTSAGRRPPVVSWGQRSRSRSRSRSRRRSSGAAQRSTSLGRGCVRARSPASTLGREQKSATPERNNTRRLSSVMDKGGPWPQLLASIVYRSSRRRIYGRTQCG